VRPPYRGDVDGLRAVAVLLVVAFHAFPRKIPGGFTGVDIFFVISGFLITSLIVRSKEKGDFSFADFYARRIKRIFPALIVVLLASLAVGWIVMFPGEYRDLGKHNAAGAGFVANFSFLQEAGYFDVTADHKPLLHLWSLGIEEQFYIIWPVLIVLAWRWRYGPLLVAGLICLGSFLWNIGLTPINPSQAFYLPFTRFWELMVGCLLALATTQPQFAELSPRRLVALYERHHAIIHEVAGWLGIALIAVATALLSADRGFPGWWALLPTLGAALLIFAGPQCRFNRLVLSHQAMIYIGLISYPLYLWHWPILSYARLLHFKEPTDLMKVGCIAAAFILAHLTYRYVERPIRFGAPSPRKPVLTAAAMAAVGCIGLLIFAGNGIPSRFPKELQAIVAEARNNPSEDFHQYRCLYQGEGAPAFDSSCDGSNQPGARRVVLWGDSHAAHLGPAFETLRRKENFKFAQYASAACPPIQGFTSRFQKPCPQLNDYVLRKIAELKPDTVIMAGRWEIYDSEKFGHFEPQALRATIARLKALGVKHIVVLGQFPTWQAKVPQLRARNYRYAALGLGARESTDVERDKTFLKASVFPADEKLRQTVAGTGAEFVSPLRTLCNGEGCLLVVPDTNGLPIYWDDNHFTRSGAIYFLEHNRAAISGS
jgi:peptidoglycan/LPS O-acetylase OafA/YrhL